MLWERRRRGGYDKMTAMINVYDEEEYDELEDDEYFDEYDDGPNLGPDELDQDLLDGSWEQAYYAGQERPRDWNSIVVGLSLLALAGMVIPLILVLIG